MSQSGEKTDDDDTEATKLEGKGSVKPKPAAPHDRLSRGTLVGRYVVLDVLGEGGMGVVYAAFDPELDRKVAVKLLQAGDGESASGGQAWLLREAQAMARLSHPNVIAVHDVGTLPGNRVFVAMELVEGPTLRRWLDEKRTWREVIAVMRQAGVGLAAAHAAGLVHRDFKPDNVLVGHDRVRVMDFGLARLELGEDLPVARDSDSQISKRSPLSDKLTVAGTIVGTPAYMAAELYSGGAADARSDQFAFGVALYEALYRERPFSRAELAHARQAPPRPPTPPNAGVPNRIQRAVMRAISIDPAQRFSSMTELLDELAYDPTAARRRVILGAAGLVAIGGLVAGGVVLARSRGELCKGAERKLAGVWDAAAKQRTRAAFDDTKHARAGVAYAAVEKALDQYAGEWTAMSVESCEATRVRGDQTERDMTLRQDCLDAHLEELRAFVKLLGKADAKIVDKAEHAAYGLDAIRQCADLATLRAPDQPPPEIRPKVAEIVAQNAAAKASMLAGQLGAAINQARASAKAAHELSLFGLESEALVSLGITEFSAGDPTDAVSDIASAAAAGVRGKQYEMFAEAALFSAMSAAQLRKDESARVWLELGIAAQARVANPILELRRLQAEGVVMARGGDLKAAIAADEKAIELAKELLKGADLILDAQLEQELANALAENLEFTKAQPHLERAVALIERGLGPDHPDLATAVGTLALVYAHTDIAKARATYERAIGIRERMLGKDSPALIPSLNNIADFLERHGDPAGALPYAERAYKLATPLGEGNPLFHTIATTRAEVLALNGRVDEARTELDKIIALEDKSHSSSFGPTLTSRAQIELDAGKPADAVTFAERARATIEAHDGKDAPGLWPTLALLGRAKLALGATAEAKPLLEHALELAKGVNATTDELAPVRDALAKIK